MAADYTFTHPTEFLAVPVTQSYWVVPGRFLAGRTPVPSVEQIRDLAAGGIRCIISLQPVQEQQRYGALVSDLVAQAKVACRCVTVPVIDFACPSVEVVGTILKEIDTALAQNEPVYLHCAGGKGRTGCIVGCWLVQHGVKPEAALQALADLRKFYGMVSHSPETEDQRSRVKSWKRL
eukprot:TRINITY_DN14669_c0_g1_i1.p1 TRINITY_DN14669_c0_g1~~TRINITY_DN14669_c0_g1_i1.p1  ORF type:complete len:178 (+),score=31.46 TRINITY_DN14669_c0_g1_i1:17-550(+)